MKPRISLPLLTCLLSGFSNLIPVHALDVTIPEGSTTRQEYTQETTVKAAGDVLSYTDWIFPDTSSTTPKGAIFHSTVNLIFSGSYGISITGSSMENMGGLIYSKDNLTFSGLGNITLTRNTATTDTSTTNNGGLIFTQNTITFSDVKDIYIANNLSEELSGGFPYLIYSDKGGIIFERTGNITFSENTSKKKTKYLSILRADTAPTVFNNTGDILFEKNKGTSLLSIAGITFVQAKSITFRDN